MNWKNITFDWNHARAFLATAETGSLSGAARALGSTQPTIGRQVSALEDELALTLFDRQDRGMKLTEAGKALLAHVKVMADGASTISTIATNKTQQVAGTIVITASEIYAAKLLPPIVKKIRTLHPNIEISIIPSNEVMNLRKREADIAIRSGMPTEPDLIARKIKDETGYFYASDRYLEAFGRPITKEDLTQADFIGFEDVNLLISGLKFFGITLKPENFPIRCDNHIVQWEMVKEGAAIGVMSASIGDKEPLVRRVAEDIGPFDYPMWLVAHRDVQSNPRIRIIFDLLAKELSL